MPQPVKRQRYGGGRELSKREAALRLITDARRAQPCADCGARLPACCMDFDHLPGASKAGNVSEMVRDHSPIPRVVAEMNKCDVVCANCHRIRTRDRKVRN